MIDLPGVSLTLRSTVRCMKGLLRVTTPAISSKSQVMAQMLRSSQGGPILGKTCDRKPCFSSSDCD